MEKKNLRNKSRAESPMNETPDEEVDYGSSGSIANPSTDSGHEWSD